MHVLKNAWISGSTAAQTDAAVAKAEVALDLATVFVKSKMNNARAESSTGPTKRTSRELGRLHTRAEDTQKKLKEFKREATQHKTQGLLHDLIEKVVDVEGLVQT